MYDKYSLIEVSSDDISRLPDQASYKINRLISFTRNIWTEVYPVGSYYETSDTNFDPAKVWGGEWEDLGSGRWHRTA